MNRVDSQRKPSILSRQWLCVALVVGLMPAIINGQTPTRRVVQDVGIDQHLNAQLDLNLQFQDDQGHVVRLGELFQGKPVILTPVYFQCPMLCTQVLNGLLEFSQAIPLEMGRDYQVVSISIDPLETREIAAAKKKRYVESYHRPGARTGWHFLTGKPESIKRLTDTIGFRYVYDPKTQQYAHASGIMLLTPSGKISRYFYGIDYPPDDLRLGLIETADNRIGTLADQFLLLCYHYDPATGKYGFVIENAIRAAGLVTMFLLGGFLWVMYRYERKRTAREQIRMMPSIAGSDRLEGST